MDERRQQQQEQPALAPSYLLRGHSSAVHALLFYNENLRLISGDSDGWIVIWDLPTRRPVAVWQGHGVHKPASSIPAAPSSAVAASQTWANNSNTPDAQAKSHSRVEELLDDEDEDENGDGPNEGPDEETPAETSLACVLGVTIWNKQIVTHGRDGWICVWSLSMKDEEDMSIQLPLDIAKGSVDTKQRRSPWLRHALRVQTLNFCAFGTCEVPLNQPRTGTSGHDTAGINTTPDVEVGADADAHNDVQADLDPKKKDTGLIIATPSINEAEIAIYHLPSDRRVGVIRVPGQTVDPMGQRTGMVMALRVRYIISSATDAVSTPSEASNAAPSPSAAVKDRAASEAGKLVVAAGFENGETIVFRQQHHSQESESESSSLKELTSGWEIIYTHKAHSQAILGLDILPAPLDVSALSVFTSGVDAIIAKHTVTLSTTGSSTAEADSRTTAVKTNNTRHASQQSLVLRDDGRIFATAGWDSRARVYSAKTCKELAVCKWHRGGCYAVGFACTSPSTVAVTAVETHRIDSRPPTTTPPDARDTNAESVQLPPPKLIKGVQGTSEPETLERHMERVLMNTSRAAPITKSIRMNHAASSTIAQRRVYETQTTHWLAVGGRDGKVSLWNIY